MDDAHGAGSSLTHKGALDANLRFPAGDPYWERFFESEHCDVASTADLDALTRQLLRHELDFCYLPAANLYFLRGDPAHRGIASARSARTGSPAQSSVLVVAKANPAADWHALRGARLGYINTYCTTSYFAPAILLAREGLALEPFFHAFAVSPWQGQIDAVVEGEIDATMVYEDVWLGRPDNAAQSKIIARLDDLPTPVFIARAHREGAFAPKLKKRLIAFAPPAVPNGLYAGFSDYQEVRMARFFVELQRLPGMSEVGAGART
jgi:phosphonate transport system substrate-binding protein